MEYIENDTRKQFFRFYDLYDLYIKKDGRRQLFFEDKGYVDNVDIFLTGCFSFLPVTFMLDGSTLNWQVISDVKKFKTMIDFYENKITCQGKYYNQIEELYFKRRFYDLLIETFVINPGAEHYDKLKDFFKL